MYIRTLLIIFILLISAVATPAEARFYGGIGTFYRLSGADRYETSVKVSEFNFGAPGIVDAFVIASGENYPDALAAAPFASRIDAPLLLTARDYLPAIVARNIKWAFDGVQDNEPDIYIVGGSAAVSDTVEAQLAALDPAIDIARVQGVNRVETSLNVALELEILANKTPSTVFLASGNNYPDALSASGPASDAFVSGDRIPIILNRGADHLDPLVASAFELYFMQGGLSEVVVLGGTSLFRDNVLSQIFDLAVANGAQIPSIYRLAGADRYETATVVAEHFYGSASPRNIGVANGESFPDALVGGYDSGRAYGGVHLQPFILIKDDAVQPQAVQDFFSLHQSSLDAGILYGGPDVLSEQARLALEGLL